MKERFFQVDFLVLKFDFFPPISYIFLKGRKLKKDWTKDKFGDFNIQDETVKSNY